MHSSDGVIVEGIDNCPIKFAKCCSPLPGDEIIGFVTRGFGVSIHKRDCANARESMRHPENADRWVRAYWDEAEKENYKATLDIVCMDRANLVSDVALALGDMRVPIYSLTARAAEQGRADDTPEAIAKRLETYEKETAPLLDIYEARGLLVVVNGVGDIDAIQANIVAALSDDSK